MENFYVNMMLLHKKASVIMEELQKQSSTGKICAEGIKANETGIGKADYPGSIEMYQEWGDLAAGTSAKLMVEYYQILREINNAVTLKEAQPNSAKELNMVKVAELFHFSTPANA